MNDEPEPSECEDQAKSVAHAWIGMGLLWLSFIPLVLGSPNPKLAPPAIVALPCGLLFTIAGVVQLVWLGECADLFNKGKPRWARVSRKVSLGAVLVWGLAVTLIGAGYVSRCG